MPSTVAARGSLPAFAVALLASTVSAQTPEPGSAPAAEPNPEPKPAKPPYSLPWQLRPVVPANVVRLDMAYALYDVKAPPDEHSANTLVTTLLFSYKVIDQLAPLVRIGHVTTKVEGSDRVSAFVNPVVGAIYGLPLGDRLKLGLFLGVALPFGQGGGDRGAPDSDTSKRYAAAGSGIYARSAMDNAMFAVNYLTFFPGVGLAYVADGLTVQAELTVLSLNRVRGGDAAEPDERRTNMTSGLHVGYFVLDMLSLGADLRYQRWLSTPRRVEDDEALPSDEQTGIRDQASFAIGPRFHLQPGPGLWLRPGIAYARGVDKPMSGDASTGPTNYHVIQLDVPFVF